MNKDEIMSLVRKMLILALSGHVGTRLTANGFDVQAIVELGVDLAVVAWGVAAHWNMKKVPETAKVVVSGVGAFLLAAALGASLVSPPASAADVAPAPIVKAIPYTSAAPTCSMTNCSGWIVGVGAMGQGSNLNIVGSGIQGSVFAGGGALDVTAGYQFWNGTWFFEPNVAFAYDLSPNSPAGAAPAQRGIFWEGMKLGTPLGNVLGQTSAPITIPTQISAALMSPYVEFGAVQRLSNATGFYLGAGAEFLLTSDMRGHGWLLDIDYKAVNYSGSQAFAPTTAVKTENWVGFSLLYKL